jgi:hypothetical protein
MQKPKNARLINIVIKVGFKEPSSVLFKRIDLSDEDLESINFSRLVTGNGPYIYSSSI